MLIMGELGGARSPSRAFSPLVGADLSAERGRRLVLPLDPGFEHALVPLQGSCWLDGQALSIDTLYYLGCGRRELVLLTGREPVRALLLGGALRRDGHDVWNFVARTTEEIVARGRPGRPGAASAKCHYGERLGAPPFVARPLPRG